MQRDEKGTHKMDTVALSSTVVIEGLYSGVHETLVFHCFAEEVVVHRCLHVFTFPFHTIVVWAAR